MQQLKTGLILALISALIAVFAMAGCNESKMNTGTNSLNPNISALNAKGGLQVSLNFIKKSMSTKASDISDVIDSVTFHITGSNLPAPINQIVQRADFKGPGWAVIQINDLLPGTINVTVEAKDASGNVIATGHQDNITVIPGDTIRIRIDCVINVGSVIIDFVCINCLPTPTVTIPASIDPPSPMPTVCCPTSAPPAKADILVYVTNTTYVSKADYDFDLPQILADAQGHYTVDVKDRSDGVITDNLLNGYKQLWIMSGTVDETIFSPYETTNPEIVAINNFRNSNHPVLVVGDHYQWDQDANLITQSWGITFEGIVNRENPFQPIKINPIHPILTDVNSLSGHSEIPGEGTIIFTPPAKAIGAYPSDKPFVGILDESNKGRVVVEAGLPRFFDANETHSNGFLAGCPDCWIRRGDSPQYTKNIADWLARIIN